MKNALTLHPKEVKALFHAHGLSYKAEGVHKNILRFDYPLAFSNAGSLLINSGYLICSHKAFASRRKVSKQAVTHWVIRDGIVIEFYYDDGRKFAFLVDSV